ncbi:MAG: peptidyl-prolyl cis-trans isomerase, partial [Planctomycetales bacterium]|nr:peptidyl-prolyl cis-trans isomerase [Planctomycetales bacterium]
MSRTLRLCALLMLLCGCNGFQKTAKKSKNPVGGEVPPRVANLLASGDRDVKPIGDESESSSKPIQATGSVDSSNSNRWVNAIPSEDTPTETAKRPRFRSLSGSDVAATVNGRPIFVAEFLDANKELLVKIEQQLEEQTAKLPSKEIQKRREELDRFREELVIRDLPAYVRRELLVQGMTSKLKDEQRKHLDEYLDADFDRYVQKILPDYGVSTRSEFAIELKKRGESFELFRTNFRNRALATQYIRMKTGDAIKKEPTRQELLAYYREHIADYSVPAQVKWQQILIQFSKHDGPDGARKAMDQAIAELRKGTDFGDVARKYSGGPTASQGGDWDWTREDSLADKPVEKALFGLGVGKISLPIENNKSIQLVKVIARKPASKTPLEQVQVEIQRKLQEVELKAA